MFGRVGQVVGRLLKWPALVLLWLVIVIVAVALSPIWVPWAIVASLSDRRRLRRFLRSRCGQVYFVWHARRGWYDFVRNNVLPVLPEGVREILDRAPAGDELRVLRRAVAQHERWGLAHPLLVFVGLKRVYAFSLNETLGPEKPWARCDVVTQRRVQRILRRAIRESVQRVAEEELGVRPEIGS